MSDEILQLYPQPAQRHASGRRSLRAGIDLIFEPGNEPGDGLAVRAALADAERLKTLYHAPPGEFYTVPEDGRRE